MQALMAGNHPTSAEVLEWSGNVDMWCAVGDGRNPDCVGASFEL
jgi:hypothetical protein